MELLKTTTNPPWSAGRNRNEKDIEFLRDLCLLDISDNMEWTLFLNNEIEKGNKLFELRNIIQLLIEQKEKRRRNREKQRRLVIWTSRLNLFFVYTQFLDKELKVNKISKFREGMYEDHVMTVVNQNLEFRNFELISGESIQDVNQTYSYNATTNIEIMKSFIEMRAKQGLSDWTSLRYTFANSSLKLFYKNAEFSDRTQSAMRLETLKRMVTLQLSQFYDNSSKCGVLLTHDNIIGKVINNVFAADINEAYNAQFVRGNDFPVSNVRKIDGKELPALIKENKWFLLVMKSEEKLDKMPPWLKPHKFENNYYYIIEQYDYISLKIIGLKLKEISKTWRVHCLYTCDEVGYLNWFFRKRIVKRYGERRYLKKLGDPREKIIKAEFKVNYGKGLQKRNFKSNEEIQRYSHFKNTYVNQIIAYHAMARNRVEMLTMLDKLNWNFVACDTDGIKTQHPDAAALFQQRNDEIKEENAKAGFINTQIGLWKFEGIYPRFIQFANKVYAYEDNGKLVCKFAGCLKEAWQGFFSNFSLDDCFFMLQYCELKIPNGIIRRSLQIENNEFCVKTVKFAYGINGIDMEMNV